MHLSHTLNWYFWAYVFISKISDSLQDPAGSISVCYQFGLVDILEKESWYQYWMTVGNKILQILPYHEMPNYLFTSQFFLFMSLSSYYRIALLWDAGVFVMIEKNREYRIS